MLSPGPPWEAVMALFPESDPMEQSTFNCPRCGALYAVTVGQRVAVESGSTRCKVCASVMVQWSTASPPTFHLIEKPKGK